MEDRSWFREDMPALWCSGCVLNILWPLPNGRHGLGPWCLLTSLPPSGPSTPVRCVRASTKTYLPLLHFHWKEGRWQGYAPHHRDRNPITSSTVLAFVVYLLRFKTVLKALYTDARNTSPVNVKFPQLWGEMRLGQTFRPHLPATWSTPLLSAPLESCMAAERTLYGSGLPGCLYPGCCISGQEQRSRNEVVFPICSSIHSAKSCGGSQWREIGFVRICEAFLKWPVSWPCRKGRIWAGGWKEGRTLQTSAGQRPPVPVSGMQSGWGCKD